MEWAYIFFLFFLPITLGVIRVIPADRLRWHVVFGAVAVMGFITWYTQLSITEVGIPTSTVQEALLPYAIGVGVTVVGLYIARRILRIPPMSDWYRHPHFLFGFAPISAVQQFAYQGFLLPIAITATDSLLWGACITAGMFGYMHAVFAHPIRHVIIGLLGGILFVTLYLIAPNLYVAIAAHMVLNIVAVYNGFFNVLGTKRTL